MWFDLFISILFVMLNNFSSQCMFNELNFRGNLTTHYFISSLIVNFLLIFRFHNHKSSAELTMSRASSVPPQRENREIVDVNDVLRASVTGTLHSLAY